MSKDGQLCWQAASLNFRIEHCAGKHNTNADALSRIRWDKSHKHSTEEMEDAGMDAVKNSTLTAEMLALFWRTCDWDCWRMLYV